MDQLNRGITVKELYAELKRCKRGCTLLGIGPVSEVTVHAAMQLAVQRRFPPIFIASRNQVDLEQFGGGYLMGGTDQSKFVGMIGEACRAYGYSGPVYVCRDHGGPWQRNSELDGKLPMAEAMEIAKQSFRADIKAGFNYLHIDPTKCPHPFDEKALCEWTVELERFCEQERKSLGLGELDYEVGAEDIQGGLTEVAAFDSFLARLVGTLRAERLPLPTCIVGQTGTLTRMDRNAGHFDRKQAAALSSAAAKHGIGLKEHNGDYLSAPTCRIHPELGISAMNVAPEFGLKETEALMHLGELEQKLIGEGWIEPDDGSSIVSILRRKTFEQAPWRKWLLEQHKGLSDREVADNELLRASITKVSGHYVFDDGQVSVARQTLYRNIDEFHPLSLSAAEYVRERVKEAIDFYVDCFRLDDINSVLTD
jgi:D-tagatose-1,6-bisphosphate aldolase subunit GatZ/KbaZ